MTHAEMLAEINRELRMRRALWNSVKDQRTGAISFVKLDHQKYYNQMESVKTLLESMTATEFKNIADRIERQARETENQTKLF